MHTRQEKKKGNPNLLAGRRVKGKIVLNDNTVYSNRVTSKPSGLVSGLFCPEY